MADLLAELDGYRAELAGYERSHKDERAALVREQIERVTGQIRTDIEKLHAQAGNHEDDGQEILAAQARVEAKRLARALPDDNEDEAGPKRAVRGRPKGRETTADTTPKERA